MKKTLLTSILISTISVAFYCFLSTQNYHETFAHNSQLDVDYDDCVPSSYNQSGNDGGEDLEDYINGNLVFHPYGEVTI